MLGLNCREVGDGTMNSKGLIAAVIGVGVGLGALIVSLHQTTSAAIRDVQAEIHEVREDVADLRVRMARMEGRMESLESVIIQAVIYKITQIPLDNRG